MDKVSVRRCLETLLILYSDQREVQVELLSAGEDTGAVGAASVVLHAAYSPRLMSLRSPRGLADEALQFSKPHIRSCEVLDLLSC
jgi:hypothetical protein